MCLRRLLMTGRPSICSSFVIIFLLALTMAGCAASRVVMYDGAEVDSSKHAIIRADPEQSGRSFSTKGRIGIVRVDGSSTTNFFSYAAHGWAGEVAVLPGKHEMVVRVDYPLSYAMGLLWLVAEAGESYVVKARSKGYSSFIWIENERTGQPTGGVSGSEDEPKQQNGPTDQSKETTAGEASR